MHVATRVAAELVGMAGPRFRPHEKVVDPGEVRLQEYASAAVFGVTAAAAGSALVTFVFRPFGLTAAGIRNLATAYVLFTAGLAWVVAYSVSRSLGPSAQPPASHAIARFASTAAVWMAPLTIFLRDNSEWSLLAVVMLVASMTRLFDFFTAPEEGEGWPTGNVASFSLLPERYVSPAIAAVLFIEISLIATAAGHVLLASFSIGAATWLWIRNHDRVRGESFRERVFSRRVSPRLSAASLLTVVALLPHLLVLSGSTYGVAGGNSWSVFTALKVVFGYVPGQAGTAQAVHGPESTGESANKVYIKGPVFPGVVLFREERVTPIVAPPVSAGEGMFGINRTQPLVIPFEGVYWIVRQPDEPPPKTSLVMRGRPTQRTFTSNDGQPLWMEAHDNLGTLIDIRCCSAIQVEVTDADARSNDVRFQLLLENTRENRRWMSLGTARSEDILPGQPRPARRTLTFAMPTHGRLERFNRFTVRYDLRGAHSYRSARIAIDNFILVPRTR